MRKLIFSSLCFMSLLSLANDSGLYFVEGSVRGQEVSNANYTYVGSYNMCFTGNGFHMRNRLENLIGNDIEKDRVQVWFKQDADAILLSFIETKCLDEGLTDGECTSNFVIRRCQ